MLIADNNRSRKMKRMANEHCNSNIVTSQGIWPKIVSVAEWWSNEHVKYLINNRPPKWLSWCAENELKTKYINWLIFFISVFSIYVHHAVWHDSSPFIVLFMLLLYVYAFIVQCAFKCSPSIPGRFVESNGFDNIVFSISFPIFFSFMCFRKHFYVF